MRFDMTVKKSYENIIARLETGADLVHKCDILVYRWMLYYSTTILHYSSNKTRKPITHRFSESQRNAFDGIEAANEVIATSYLMCISSSLIGDGNVRQMAPDPMVSVLPTDAITPVGSRLYYTRLSRRRLQLTHPSIQQNECDVQTNA